MTHRSSRAIPLAAAALIGFGMAAGCSRTAVSPAVPTPTVIGLLPKVVQDGHPPARWVEYPLGGALTPGGVIVVGGDMWVAQGTALTRVHIASGTVKSFSTPTGGYPQDVALGPDGNLWTTLGVTGGAYIARFTPAGAGQWKLFALPSSDQPGLIVSGPRKLLWFSAGDNGQSIEAMNTHGNIVIAAGAADTVTSMLVGPDGDVWFTTGGGQSYDIGDVGFVTPAGNLTEYSTPTKQHLTLGIAAGSDGKFWFAEQMKNIIASVSAAGQVTEYRVIQNAPDVLGAIGDQIWFSHNDGLATFDVTTHAVEPLGRYPNEYNPERTGQSVVGPDGDFWFPASNYETGFLSVFVRNLITVSPISLALSVGQQSQLTASEKPAHALTARSSDPTIATVAGSRPPFTVTGMKTGSCTIRVTDGQLNYFDVAVTVR